MTTPELPDRPHSITLSLSREAQWTLHHVLLDRIDRAGTADAPTSDESPSLEVYQAFERLDAGSTCFTLPQLEAIQTVLGEYHHTSTWWELERAKIEDLLYRITAHLDQYRAPSSTK